MISKKELLAGTKSTFHSKSMAYLSTMLISTSLFSPVAPAFANTDSSIANVENQISTVAATMSENEKKVAELQTEVDRLSTERQSLQAENEQLQATSALLSVEIDKLSKDIVARDGLLEEQARNAQVNSSALSYINTIVDSKSIPDAINKVIAMNTLMSANKEMLEKQEADKERIQEAQKTNQESITKVAANIEQLNTDEYLLNAKQAELHVAQLGLQAEKATLEEEKVALEQKKAQAELEAQTRVEELAAFQAQQEALKQQQVASIAEATTPAAQEVVAEPAAEEVAYTQSTESYPQTVETPAVSQSTTSQVATSYSSSTSYAAKNATYSAASYPTGECTWGVKSQLAWVGPYWGNANQWVASATAEGFSVGTTPTVGSIAVWTGGTYGHVALVTAVQSNNSIQVSESNYAGNRYIGNFRGWFDPTVTSEGTVYYIYPPQ